MKTLFLGSSGFIGEALLSKMRSEDVQVLIRKQSSSKSSIRSIYGDLENRQTLHDIASLNFERIIDCAWTGLPNLNRTNNENNLKTKIQLIEILAANGLKQYVGLGTCLEYGSLTGKVSENLIGRDVDEFGRTKLKILRYLSESTVDFIWFRPFYLYGSKQHENSLIKSALRKISKGYDFESSKPTCSFDFINIADAVNAMSLVIRNKQISGIVNVGTGVTHSVNEVVNVIRGLYGVPQTDISPEMGLSADMSRIQTITNWVPEKSFSEGITETVKEIRGF